MNEYIITNKTKGKVLKDLETWKDGFIEVDGGPKHWKEGFSAHSLGLFFTKILEGHTHTVGQEWTDGLVERITGMPFEFSDAMIEHASKVDSFKGGQRMQDLSIWGKAGNKTVFIAVEAKVLESFDKTVLEAYNEAIKYKENINSNSKKYKRIEDLIARFFPQELPIDGSIGNLRYQLLHYVAASQQEGCSLKESEKSISDREKADIVILPVLVFKTQHYLTDIEKANENKKDYLECMHSIGFRTEGSLKYNGNDVFVMHSNEQTLYTIYAEIGL